VVYRANMLEDLDRLFRENADAIQRLQSQLVEVDLEPEFDEFMLLKYVLSAEGDVKKAAETVKKANEYRREHTWLKKARFGGRPPHHDEVHDIYVSGEHGLTRKGDQIVFIRAGNTMTMLKKSSAANEIADKFVDWVVYVKEVTQRMNDIRSKRDRKLYKTISIVDFTGMPFYVNMRYGKALGKSSKISEMIHPQFSEKQVFTNMPSYFNALYKVVKPFLSKKVGSHFCLCPYRT